MPQRKEFKMNKTELKTYKALLIAQKAKFIEELKHISEAHLNKSQRDASGDLSGYSIHMADAATDSYDKDFSLGLATSGQKILYQIDEALKRIEDGTYGVCEYCEKPIAKKRLKALPYGAYCIKCQSQEESGRH